MDVPSTYAVHSFAHFDGELDPDVSADITHARWKAEVWESAPVRDVHDIFLECARAKEAEAWYSPLTDEDCTLWLHYYGSSFDVRRYAMKIPDEVTTLLEKARHRECFQDFEVRQNTARQQFVLFGILIKDWRQVYVPIAGWYPEGAPLPTSEEIKRHFEAAEAEEAVAREARAEKAREESQRYKEEQRRSKKAARICWAIALSALAVIVALFAMVVGWWAVAPAVVIAFVAWLMWNEFEYFALVPLRRLCCSLGIFTLVSGLVLGATWMQYGTVSKDLTLCQSLSDHFEYATPDGDQYVLSHDAWGQLASGVADDMSENAVKARVEVENKFFFGDPEVTSVRVTGDGYEACYPM